MSYFLNILKVGRAFNQNQRYIFIGQPLRLICHDKEKQVFLFEIEQDENAEVHYRQHNHYVNIIDLHHTYVPKKYRGRGIADMMAEEVFEYLFKHQARVTISCPFLIRFIQDHPEFKKIVFEEPEENNKPL